MVVRQIPDDLKEVAKEYDKKIKVMTKENSWQNLLKMNSDGGVKTRSVYNIQLFINHDGLFKGLIAYDEFADQIIKTADVPTLKIKKGFWTDSDDAILRVYLESRYNLLFGKDNITDAVVSISREKQSIQLKKESKVSNGTVSRELPTILQII